MLLHPQSYCRSKVWGDVIALPSTPAPTTQITAFRVIQQCANPVAKNIINEGHCSFIFQTGAMDGSCSCLRQGYICDRKDDETENKSKGRYFATIGIYRVSVSSQMSKTSNIFFFRHFNFRKKRIFLECTASGKLPEHSKSVSLDAKVKLSAGRSLCVKKTSLLVSV